MQIVFLSNYMNHHQRPFVEQLAQCGCEVIFVASEKMSEERKKMGYTSEVKDVRYIEYDDENAEQIHNLVMGADAAIFGWKQENLFRERVKSGKLTFNYSERLFKRGEWQRFVPRNLRKLRNKYLFDQEHIPYLLSAGQYCAQDYLHLGYPRERVLKWGYFPPLTTTPLPELLQNKKENTIIWVGRFMKLKHPEYVLELGRYLKKKSIPFHIKMIGVGPLQEKIKEQIKQYNLSSQITVIDGLTPEQVRKEFDMARISLMTSDRREGWGAVINEAMNSACAMVASGAVGSTTYLIRDGVNGIRYEKSKRQVFTAVEALLRNPEQCVRLGTQANVTIADLWNYRVAAERMISFVKDQQVLWDEGPLSRG